MICLGDRIWRWLLTLDINLDWPVLGLRDAAFADWCAVDGLLWPQLDRSATLAICDSAPAQHLKVDAAQAVSSWTFLLLPTDDYGAMAKYALRLNYVVLDI